MKPAIPPPRAAAAAPTMASNKAGPPNPAQTTKSNTTAGGPAGAKTPGPPGPNTPKPGASAGAAKPAAKKQILPPIPVVQGDMTFGENTYVFVPDLEQSYLPAKVLTSFKQGDDTGEVEVIGGNKLTLGKLQTKECLLMDSQSLETIDNMVEFRVLNEASLLHNLRVRYYKDEIYTTIGDILVSVNPFKMVEIYTPDVMDLYIRRKSKAPHVFRVADSAFRAMEDSRKAQSCIVAGESGAGKTEATKVFLQYLAEVSARNEKALGAKGMQAPSRGQGANGSTLGESRTSLQEKILEANPLLEAFGNAKTVRNDNSSRFGKWIEVSFDGATSTIVGGSITSYLLEKTRVVFVANGERNYHIFYQLVAAAGLDKTLRNKYCLSGAPTDYHYLNQSNCVQVEEINDARGWHQTEKAMEVVGIGSNNKEVYATLAGILHLGNVSFGSGDKAAIATPASNDSLDFAAQCFGFPKEDLERALLKRDVSVRGEKIFKDNNPFQAGLQRDGLSKAVYGLLFDWLLYAVNRSLLTKLMEEDDVTRQENNALIAQYEKAVADFQNNPKRIGGATGPKMPELKKYKLVSIGVLDIFGFESFTKNSFEQLCINYCNEKLQGHFNSFVFTLEQTVYAAEGLDVSQIEFKDNSQILECLELKKKGIFSLVDEENAMPNSSDASLLKKILEVNADLVRKPDMNALRANPEMSQVFIVVHYAGNVGYTVDGFLEKNKDELAPELTNLLENSQREFILDLHSTADHEEAERAKKLVSSGGSEGSSNGRRHSAMVEKKKQSLGSKFKDQLALLMSTLNATAPHFVRCIKPNMEKVADSFTAPMVLSQLRYSGLLEVCRIRQQGYPVQKSFGEFAFRYGPLCVPPPAKRNDHNAVAVALEKQNLIPERKSGMWQLGKTKVFMRQQVFNGLERTREAKLKVFVRHMQRVARGFVERRKFRRYKQMLSNLEKAIGTTSEAVLEKAILDSGGLPYNGVHLPLIRRAHEALSRLRAIAKARTMIGEAMAAKELSAITQALAFGDEVGLSKEEQVYKQAQAMVAVIVQETEVKQALRVAMQSRSITAIRTCLSQARACNLVDLSADIAEGEAMQARLERIEQVAKQIESIATGGKTTDALADEVMKLVTVLIEELGAKDHPAVLQGETFAKRQAEVSAVHKKRVLELKTKLKQAATERRLDDLVALEMEAVQIGIASDADLVPVLAVRAKLEQAKEAESKLVSAMNGVVAKSELPEGANESDIASLEQLIASLSTIVPSDSDAMVKAKDLVQLIKKQLQAKQRLQKALQNANQKGGDAAIEQAVKDAQSLGMQDETARRGQALLHLKTLAAEEKREMRRRSLLNGPLILSAAERDDLDEIQEQPWLLEDAVDEDDEADQRGSARDLKLAKQTTEGRAELIAKRIEAANSTEWNETMRASSSDVYRFESFIGLRTDQDFTDREPSETKKQLAVTKCSHSSQVVPKSLLKLEEEVSEEAVKVFKSVLGWAGDQTAQFPQTLAMSVLKNGLQTIALRDEIYCQLMKQLNGNPDKESEDRTWLLLCLCTEMFGPSKEFLRFVVNFLLRHYSDQGMRGNYSKWCAYQLSATEKLGPSNFLPETKDINFYTTRPPVIIRVHLIYQVLFEHMSWTDIPVWPDQDVGFVEKMIAQSQHIPVEVRKVSGLFLKDIDLERPKGLGQTFSEDKTPPASPATHEKRELPPRLAQLTVPPSPSGSEQSPAPTPTGKKKNFLSSMMSRARGDSGTTESSTIAEEGEQTGDESPTRRRTITSKFGALSKSFRIRRLVTDKDGDDGEEPLLTPSGRKSFRMSRVKSFKVKQPSATSPRPNSSNPVSPTGSESSRYSTAPNQFVAVGAASGGMTSYSNQDDPNAAQPEITSQQVSRVPPPPFAPWPLPKTFFLGDVFLRLVSQDRLPFLTYQRKLFLDDIKPDKPMFIQIMQDVVNNRLPIVDQYQVLDLSCIATIRSAVARKQPPPKTRDELLQAGLLNYIPPTWLYGVHENYWTDAALSYLSIPPGSFLMDFTEAKLYERYIGICQQQYLFGSALFSVIHKDLPGNYVAAVNYQGLHVLTNDGSPVCLATITFQEMLKFGASTTFVWISIQEETVQRLVNLIQNEEDKTKGVLYLHTQQARELYSLLIDYSYWFRHGSIRE